MKRFNTILSIVTVTSMAAMSTASAAGAHKLQLAAGFAKGNGSYDVIARQQPGAKLDLYINDKTPVSAVVNKQGWATFRAVKLPQTGKLSFTQVFTGVKGKQYQKSINYVRYYTANGSGLKLATAPLQVAPAASAPAAAVASTPTPAVAPAPVNPPAAAASSTTGVGDNDVSNDNTYTNVDGTTVHSPAASTDGAVPAGATGKCNDGTYTFAQNHRGACSYHGGVASWL